MPSKGATSAASESTSHSSRKPFSKRKPTGAMPEFKVTPLNDGQLDVICQRTHCKKAHTVHRTAWLEGCGPAQGTTTRPCPHCIRFSKIPEGLTC